MPHPRPLSFLNALILAVFSGLILTWLIPFTPLRSFEVTAILASPDRAFATVLALLSIFALLAAWRSPEHRKRWLLTALVGLVATALFVGRVWHQGTDGEVPSAANPALRILSWNAQGVAPVEIADRLWREIEHESIDAIVLPETGDAIAEMVSDRLDILGWRHVLFEREATSVLMRNALAQDGQYSLLEGNPPWAGITVAPRQATARTPTFVAVHVQQPSFGNIQIREEHISWVQEACAHDYVIAVGDFNSTLNHLDNATLGQCVDVSASLGAGAAGTWPTWLPHWLGLSIDRAMVSHPYKPTEFGFKVLYHFDTSGQNGWGTGAGADHWPIVVEVPAEK